MRITKMLIGLLLVLCVACDKSERETLSGLKYKVVKEGTGVPAKEGELLLFNFILKDSKDSIYRSTYEVDFPQYMPMRDTTGMSREDGLTQMLRMLKQGDSVHVTIPIKDFFKNYRREALPPEQDSTLDLIFQFKVEAIMSRDSFMTYQRDFYAKLQQEQIVKDSVAIEAYLLKNNITAQKTESGLYYSITRPGQGENGKPGQAAKVDYAGYTLEGAYFDTSIKSVAMEKGLYNPEREKFMPYGPYEFTIDRREVINGWDEALKVLNKGSKATIFVPSRMAYGPQGQNRIKPNEVLIFELEVVDLKDKKDEKQGKDEK